ncbi:MAG: hypothetical protein RQ748_13055, partial [Elusimicrobiales bacterium]|nr:hypothetical protein [Elusimicrobiales bacterium]
MRSLTRAALRLSGILTAVLMLSTCEFLFYSPAFMPAVSEVEVEVGALFWTEYYNGDMTGEWSFGWTPPQLSGGANITTVRTVPAMNALRFSDEGWHGINEFLPMLFGGAGVSFGGAGSGNGFFHGIYPVNYDYSSFQPLEYDLPFPAMEGIGESGPTKSLSGGLTVVETVIYGSGRDELN